MASVTVSKAAFKSHLIELGIDALAEKFKSEGIETDADVAYAVSEPTNPKVIEDELVKPLCDQNKGHSIKVRRLFAHAYAVTNADTERFASTSTEPLVRLHPAEREARRTELAKRIAGFKLEGENDPSARLCDRFKTIMATSLVRYISWAKSTAFTSELLEQPDVPGLRIDDKGGGG